MEKDVLEKYKMNSRAEAVAFLKSLWNEAPQPCPLCNGKLDFLHKKAKKNNSDWKCTGCGERYDAIKLLNLLNEGFWSVRFDFAYREMDLQCRKKR